MKNIKFEEVQNLLNSGKQPKKLFDFVNDFSNGFGIVQLNGKQNYIKSDGTFLSDTWFNECYNFFNGLAKVILDGETCYINQKGELLQ